MGGAFAFTDNGAIGTVHVIMPTGRLGGGATVRGLGPEQRSSLALSSIQSVLVDVRRRNIRARNITAGGSRNICRLLSDSHHHFDYLRTRGRLPL